MSQPYEAQEKELDGFLVTLKELRGKVKNENGGKSDLRTAERLREDLKLEDFYIDLEVPADTESVKLFGKNLDKDMRFNVGLDMNVFFSDTIIRKNGDKLLINKAALLMSEIFEKEFENSSVKEFTPDSNSFKAETADCRVSSFNTEDSSVKFEAWAPSQKVSWKIKNEGKDVNPGTIVLILTDTNGKINASIDASNNDSTFAFYPLSYNAEITEPVNSTARKSYIFLGEDNKVIGKTSITFNCIGYPEKPTEAK